MNVDRTLSSSSVYTSQLRGAPKQGSPTGQPDPLTGADKVNFSDHEALLGQLRSIPEIREEIVALGRQLASDPDYPSDEALNALAEIMASDSDEEIIPGE